MSPSSMKWLGVLGAAAMLSLSGMGRAQAANGLLATYYAWDAAALGCPATGPDRAGIFVPGNVTWVRTDPQVNMDFGNAPAPNTPADDFAVSWKGFITVPKTGTYSFGTKSDDGIRLWIGDSPGATFDPATGTWSVEAWVPRGVPADDDGPVVLDLTAGTKYPVYIEFFECGGGNAAYLDYTSDDQTTSTPVPSAWLTPPDSTDTTAPGAPSGLTVKSTTSASAVLTLTAPGDDGATGTAAAYQVKRSISPFTADNADKAGDAVIKDKPAAGGTSQDITVTGLQQIQKYYFAVRAVDEAGNVGPWSNVTTGSTIAEAFNLPSGTDGQPGTVVYLYSPTPQTNGDRLSQMFIPSLFVKANVETTIDQKDAYADDNGVNNEAWAMRYTFTLTFDAAGTWYLDNNTDDGGRVWFRDAPINITNPGPPDAEDWSGHGPRETFTKPLTVVANKKYYVLFEWYESGGGAQAQLLIGQDTDAHSDKEIITSDSTMGYHMQTWYLKASDFAAQGRINGVVKLADGTPVAGATVTAKAADNTTTSANTNLLGGYTLLLPGGDYTLTAAGALPNGVRGTGSLAGTATSTVGQILADKDIALNAIPLADNLTAPTDKVVYRDENQTTNWSGAATADRIRDYYVGKGYTEKNADDLATWMQQHVTSKTPSVVIFANDIVPAQIVALTDDTPPKIAPNPLLRQYLDAGGRVVFLADIPFYNISKDNANINFAQPGSTPVIGINASGGSWDVGTKPTETDAAKALGLSGDFVGNRGLREALAGDVDITLGRAPDGNANDWIKFFPNTDGTGAFIRVIDEDPSEGDPTDPATPYPLTDAMLADIQKLAEYGGPLKSLLSGGPVIGCKGDANVDKAVDVNDAVAILRHIVGIGDPLTGQNLTNANVNGDANVDVNDAVGVLQAIVGIDNGLGINLTCSG